MITFDYDKHAIFEPPTLNIAGNPKRALMIFDDIIWEDYVLKNEKLKIFPVKNINGKVFNTFRAISYKGKKVILMSPNMGGSAAATDLELLIASGINKIVSFGTCGAMEKAIRQNTIIIPDAAVREEGVSYHYLASDDEIVQTPSMINIITTAFLKSDIPTIVGKIWTTDAVYRETKNKLQYMKNIGCIAVDMETASLLAVAKFRNVKLASFLITEDNIDGKNNNPHKRDSEKIFQAAMETVLNIG